MLVRADVSLEAGSMVEEKALLLETAPPVAAITLNRPARRNALSVPVMRELTSALEEASSNPAVRAVVIRAVGPVFSAGHDLSELVDGDETAYRQVFDACVEMMETIQRIPQPVIAAVSGIATAAGCQLVATCDLAVATEDARFATPGVRIGLFCSTPMVAVSRAIGRKRAMEMLLTGELVDAPTAAAWGLVNRVVPADQLETAVAELVQKISSVSPYTVSIGKRAFYEQIDMPQGAAYQYARDVMVENALAADAQEGMSAFLEKRSPTWRGVSKR